MIATSYMATVIVFDVSKLLSFGQGRRAAASGRRSAPILPSCAAGDWCVYLAHLPPAGRDGGRLLGAVYLAQPAGCGGSRRIEQQLVEDRPARSVAHVNAIDRSRRSSNREEAEVEFVSLDDR